MLRVRVIPCLQLVGQNIVKSVRFKKPSYIGDFVNTARIFNELEVDEMCVLGIRMTLDSNEPDFKILEELANECFMPLSYGGGINSFETAKKILTMGYEKLIINSHSFKDLSLIGQLSRHFGSQSVIGAIDVKKNWSGKKQVMSRSGTQRTGYDPVSWALKLEQAGVGEILLTSVDHEGTWEGFDFELVSEVSQAVSIPVIAHGGAGSLDHLGAVVRDFGASAVAIGSMVVYQKKGMGVLVNFPDRQLLKNLFT